LNSGCPDKPSTNTTTSTGNSATAEANEQKCTEFLQSVFDIFRLDRLGISSNPSDGVGLLNQWQRDCGAQIVVDFPALDDAATRLLTPPQLDQLKAERYSTQDGERLRDCVLFRKVSEYAVGSADNDLGRVLNVFDHVIRNIDLVPRHYENLPLTPYESYTFGSGTAEDRAWIFIGILRQLKIDAVIVSPRRVDGAEVATPGESTGSPFLVGVLLNDNVYLFEPRFGLPLRPASEDAVATLAQVIAAPDLLKQFDLDADHPSPYSADGLREPRFEIVGDPSLFSSRMRTLQSQFSGTQTTVLSDPLQDVDGNPGLLARMAKAGAKQGPPDSVRLWSYAGSQLAAYAALSEDQQGKLAGLKAVWNAPRVVENPEAGVPVRRRKLIHARTAHVGGDFDDAIVAYGLVRLIGPTRPGSIDQFVNNQAADHAFFWKGICQYEKGDFRGAVDTFEKYLKQSASGSWQAACRYQLARSQAATGNLAAAIKTLEETPESDHRRAGHLLLAREWKRKLKE
jgi:tetratricopeptide (TPR) repeat protein